MGVFTAGTLAFAISTYDFYQKFIPPEHNITSYNITKFDAFGSENLRDEIRIGFGMPSGMLGILAAFYRKKEEVKFSDNMDTDDGVVRNRLRFRPPHYDY